MPDEVPPPPVPSPLATVPQRGHWKPLPKWWKPFRIVAGIATGVLVLLLVMVQLARGHKVLITDQEEIYYASGATKDDALKLGQGLKALGCFDGSSKKSVQVRREGGAVVVRFVLEAGAWNNEETVKYFRGIRASLAEKTFSPEPVIVCLCDDHFNTMKTLK